VITEAKFDEFYSVFASVPKPGSIDYCPCCMTADEIDSIRTVPKRELPEDLVFKYLGNAFHTVGDAADYHYIFPRIFELLLSRGVVAAEVALGNLKRANWKNWPIEQRHATVSLLNLHFDSLASLGDEWVVIDIEDLLCGIARAGISIRPFLEKLETPKFANAFENFVMHLSGIHSNGHLPNSFWDGAQDSANDLVEWLNRPEARKIVEVNLGMKFD